MGTPPDVVTKLNRTLTAVTNTPEVQEALKIQGVDPEPGAPGAVAARIAADVVKWKEVVRSAKIAGTQ
jgi:tripartite-type tricarboxylate transporter receptor subunit TctC